MSIIVVLGVVLCALLAAVADVLVLRDGRRVSGALVEVRFLEDNSGSLRVVIAY